MTRSFLSPTAARRLSQQTARFFSTSRPALRLSASSVGEVTTCRQTSAFSPDTSLYKIAVPRSIARSPFRQQVAYFSSSSIRPAAKVIQNPRTGDDGETLMIGISPRAVEVRFMIIFSFFDLPGYFPKSRVMVRKRITLGSSRPELHGKPLLVPSSQLGGSDPTAAP